jgi:selenocysteine-specific elongation factor
MRVIATAGHVDHGKSSLVLALTGTDPDRFAEEKRRGLTIDLGFAFTTLPSGTEIGFVDVPGHVKFVKNMLAGVGAVDVVLFVVSAREGWMPQSEEHLVILELLGVRHGVVAVTNADRVDADTLATVRTEIAARLATSTLAGVTLVACDSVTGRGIDDVCAALDAALAAAPPPNDTGRPRLWIDRVFGTPGAGLVVTGTLGDGAVMRDDGLVVARDGTRVRVRGIESAHRAADRADAGSRVALKLSGVDRGALARGDALVRPGQWTAARVVDVATTPTGPHALERPGRLQAHVGSGEHVVSFRPLDDQGRYGRLWFAEPVALAPGDRFVLRDPGREEIAGGAEVLDVAPPRSTRDAAARLSLPLGERLLNGHARVAVADVPRLTGLSGERAADLVSSLVSSGVAYQASNTLFPAAIVAKAREHAHALIANGGEADLASVANTLSLDSAVLRAMLDSDARLVVTRGRVRDASRAPIVESPDALALVSALDTSPFAPPEPSDIALARALVREGVLVDVDGIVFTASAVEHAKRLIRDHLDAHETMTVADARNVLGSTRKYVVPLLEYFDRQGVTRRRGDVRIAGPR